MPLQYFRIFSVVLFSLDPVYCLCNSSKLCFKAALFVETNSIVNNFEYLCMFISP